MTRKECGAKETAWIAQLASAAKTHRVLPWTVTNADEDACTIWSKDAAWADKEAEVTEAEVTEVTEVEAVTICLVLIVKVS